MKKEIYGAYSASNDITFIMTDTFDDDGNILSTEVTGFIYGNEENNMVALQKFNGNIKAEF